MRARRFLAMCAAAALILAAVAAPAMAPDAVKVSPDKYRVLFENEKVRLLRIQPISSMCSNRESGSSRSRTANPSSRT